MSQFNSKLYRVRDFVHSLINHRENQRFLVYEPTIKYAKFPSLDLHADDEETFGKSVCEEHTEVFDTLGWLGDKGVSTIIELRVPDRLANPHNELEIAKYVKRFKVETLDWRFLDMSLSIFDADDKHRIRELHLYSSGKRAAISHWLSTDGLTSFPNVRRLQRHEPIARLHVFPYHSPVSSALVRLHSCHPRDDGKIVLQRNLQVHPSRA